MRSAASRGEGRHDVVAVDVHRRAHLVVWLSSSMTTLGVHALAQQKRRSCVPAVVEADMADAGLLQQAGPVVVVGLLVDGAAVGLGEEQVSSCHSEPASIRSPRCAALCRCRSAKSDSGSARVRSPQDRRLSVTSLRSRRRRCQRCSGGSPPIKATSAW
jgi:hypothetical protein